MRSYLFCFLFFISTGAFGQYYIEGIAPVDLNEFNVDLIKTRADSLYAAGDYHAAAEQYLNLKDNWVSIRRDLRSSTKEQIQNLFFSEVMYHKTKFRTGIREESYNSLRILGQQIARLLGDEHLFFGMYYHELGLMTFQHLEDAQQSYTQTYKAMKIREQQLPQYKKDLGWSYNNLAIITRRLFGMDSSLVYGFKALETRKEISPPDPGMVLVSYSNISQEYLITGDYKKEKEYLLKAKEAGLSLKEDHPYNLMVQTNLAKLLARESDFKEALKLSKKVLSLRRKKISGEGVIELRDNYQAIADNYLNLGYTDSSAMYLDTIISHMHKYENNYAITLLYTALAKTKSNQDEAISLLKEAIRLCQVDSECNEIWIADIFHEISQNYISKNDPYQAIVFALKAKEIYDRIPNGNRPNHVKLYRTLANISYQINNKKEAVEYLKSSIKMQERDTLINEYWSIDTYMTLAKLYTELEEYNDAEQTFEKLFEIIDSNANVPAGVRRDAYRYQSLYYQNKGDIASSLKSALLSKSFVTSETYDDNLNALSIVRLFRAYQATGENDKAKTEFENACELLGVDGWLKGNYEKPNLPSHRLVTSIEQIVDLYKDSEDYFFKDIGSQLTLIRTIIEMIDACRNNFFLLSSEQELYEIESKLYHLVIGQLYGEYNESGSETILEVVLLIMEKSRSIGMRRVSNRKNLQGVDKPPLKLTAEENRITFQSEKIFQEYSQNKIQSNDSLLLNMTSQLEKLDQEKDALIQTLKTDYPAYFKARYEHEVITLNEIASISQDEDIGFINYYVANEYIYRLSINGDETLLTKIALPELEKQIEDLKAFLSNAHSKINEHEYRSTRKSFIELASYLYNTLVGDELKNNLPERLVIIPDKELLNLPFEVLLMDTVSSDANYKSLPYLIQEKTISYNGSLTQYYKSGSSTIGENYYGYAPVYDYGKPKIESTQSQTSILPLKRNIEEIENCSDLFVGNHYVGDEASVDAFKNNLTDVDILHLAMHTYVDDRVPLDSYLNFTSNGHQERNKLYAHEIVEMHIGADLVVLSACETNVGKQVEGEGIRGIARSFFIAACPNLLITNWVVDDHSSNRIIYNFLKGIKGGVDPASSLRSSKLSFIDNCSNVHAHPSYWAPFTYYGGPISNRDNSKSTAYIPYAISSLFFVFVALILGLRLFRK